MRGFRAALAAVTLLAGGLGAGQASAAAVFLFQEQGGDVVGTLSGSLSLGTAGFPGAFTNGTLIGPSDGELLSATTGGTTTDGYVVSGPASFGAGPGGAPDSRSGLAMHLLGSFGLLYLDASYSSGDPLSGGMVFTGTDFTTLGITPGDYVYVLRSQDTLTLRFVSTPAAVPAPASLPILAGALGMLGFAMRRRRQTG